MAFSTEEQKIIQYAKDNGKSADQAREAIANYRQSMTPVNQAPQQAEVPQRGFLNQAADFGKGVVSGFSAPGRFLQNQIMNPLQRAIIGENPLTTTDSKPFATDTTAGKVGNFIGESVPFLATGGVAGAATKGVGIVGRAGVQGLAAAGTQAIVEQDINQGTAITGALSSAIPVAGRLLPVGLEVAKSGSRATSNLINNAKSVIKSDKVQNFITPKKGVSDAAGEILQGKPTDVSKGVKALSTIDINGVKTYADLGNKVNESIKGLSRVVDEELGKDLTTTKLIDLTTELKTKSGNTVKTNYVDTALKHLKEMYQKTGDIQGAANIDELVTTANTQGLTKLDINNIARVYNVEFGSKAFGKLDEPLTSVNAQLYETIRTGVKNKARQGIGGDAAKAADKTISDLYSTKRLVDKNTEAVNKLKQKISERGAFEKAGYLVSKYADVLTGGSIRGFVGGILPRGAGYKTMNALDLEQRLSSNLEIIKRAQGAKTPAEMEKILGEIKS